MGSKTKFFIVIVILGLIWQYMSTPGEVSLGPGVLAPDAPRQTDLREPESLTDGDYVFTKLARFELRAKVLSREDYRFDDGADLVPIDLALGWGNMSDEDVLKDIEITQSRRFYWWRVDGSEPPIPIREIETSSANMHMIPANDDVARELRRVRRGDIIELEGYLVRAQTHDGLWKWLTSLTREDTGAGACELVRVEKFAVIDI